MSLPSEALYSPIPQSIEVADDAAPQSLPTPTNPLSDTRIRWIHFILGSSVLLPWNGTVYSIVLLDSAVYIFYSDNHRNAIFLRSACELTTQINFQFISDDLIHCRQFYISCSCHRDSESRQLGSIMSCKSLF